MKTLKATSDRKTQAYPGQKNTFGLLYGPPSKGGTCPGATEGCGGCCHVPDGRKTSVCYVDRLALARPNVYKVLEYNTELIRNAIYTEKVVLLTQEFLRFYKTELKKKKVNRNDLWYRLHWSGDIPDEEYAHALKEAIESVPKVNFWGYTRSFFSVPILAGIDNLQLYLSLDSVNENEGLELYRKMYREHDNVSCSWMTDEKPNDAVTACPVDIGRMDLQGACMKCRRCLTGKQIWFKIR